MSVRSVVGATTTTAAATAPTSNNDGGSAKTADFRRVLRRLQQRPDVLLSNLSRIDRQLEELCLKDYHVHIQNHRCFQHAREVSAETAASAAQLRSLVPRMKAICEDDRPGALSRVAADIAAKHSLNQKTLAQHNRLLELLEVPQLMDTCVRKGQHHQAVQLLAFANTLERKHSNRKNHHRNNNADNAGSPRGLTGRFSGAQDIGVLSAPVVESIIDDVRRSALALRMNLLRSLRQDVKLPACLATMAVLKRLERLLQTALYLEPDVLDAVRGFDLRREFLRNRDEWLSKSLRTSVSIATEREKARKSSAAVGTAGGPSAQDDDGGFGTSTDDAFHFLMAVVDRSRILWFDVITQYRAVFSLLANRAVSTRSLRTSQGTTAQGADDGDEASASLLAAWVALRVRELHTLLRRCLPHICDGAEIARVLDQCMYFGASLGRLAADFRAVVLPTFEAHIEQLMGRHWAEARALFGKDLRAVAGSAPKIFIAEESVLTFSEDVGAYHAPPNWYLAFPPLANLANAVLMSLNDLRHVPLLSLKLALASRFKDLVLRGCAVELAAAIPTLAATTSLGSNAKVRAHYHLLCLAVFRHALPFFAHCFKVVFCGAASSASSAASASPRPLFALSSCSDSFQAVVRKQCAGVGVPHEWVQQLLKASTIASQHVSGSDVNIADTTFSVDASDVGGEGEEFQSGVELRHGDQGSTQGSDENEQQVPSGHSDVEDN